jgi:Na+-driven multidrug efflux pump
MDKAIQLGIIFLAFFIMVYCGYYGFIRRPFIRARKKQKDKKIPADISIMKNYFKIDFDKIGYNTALRLLNFVNAFLVALITTLIVGLKGYVIQMIVAALLVFPLILGSYSLVARILKRKERKIKNV